MAADFSVCVCELNIKHVVFFGKSGEGGRHSLNIVSRAMLDGDGDEEIKSNPDEIITASP